MYLNYFLVLEFSDLNIMSNLSQIKPLMGNNFKQWEEKSFALVCSEVNLSSVSRYTWWIDSDATTNISMSMQGCLSHCKPSKAERYVYVGNGSKVEVKSIGKFRLLCRTGFYF